MRTAETTLSPLLDALSDGVCLSEADGTLLYMNPAAERLLDVRREQAAGLRLCDLLCAHLSTPSCADCASGCALRRPGASETAVTFRGRFGPRLSFEWKGLEVHRRQQWKHLRVRCLSLSAPGFDPGAPGKHFTIIEDGSAEAELERTREDWRSMAAHDLRAPLTSVYGTLKVLAEMKAGASLTEMDAKLIGASVKSCARLLELLGLYLELARFDAGMMPVRPEALSLRALARECAGEQEALARERGAQLAIDIPEEARVVADRELLARVLVNLVNNALKYGRAGGKVSVLSRAAERGAFELVVADEGPGIVPEDLPSLFDRYSQGRARRAGRTQGTGLGLAFCREAMAAMGGTIAARSTPGEGSEFLIRLPAAPQEAP